MSTSPSPFVSLLVRNPEIDVIYLCGPMTGLPEFGYPAFRAAAETLRIAGYQVYNPTERLNANGVALDTTGMTGTERLPKDVFDLRAAFADYTAFITTTADAIAVLPGWETSKGAIAEVMLGRSIGLPIIDALTGEPVDPDVVLHQPHLSVVPTATEAPEGPARFAPATPTERAEVKATSATGGSKATKEARLDLVPAGPLWELSVLYGRGQMKYPDAVSGAPNWKRGYPWSSSYSALIRHANLFWMGEDHDPEMAVKHMMAVAWHAFNLAWFMENRPEFDDRPTSVNGERYDGALPTPQWLVDLVQDRSDQADAEQAEQETETDK